MKEKKGTSCFCRINRFNTACMVFGLTLGVAGQGIAAEEDSRKLDEMVVTATKWETTIDAIPTNTEVITREDLEKFSSSTTLNELLNQVPGLYVPQFQSGIACDGIYSSRGSEPSAWGIRLLVNGIEFNKGNGYSVPPRIPLNDIERIEIIKTPSAEYGDQAVGGLINIITRIAKKPFEAKAGAGFGDFDYQRFYAVVNGSQDKLEYFVDLNTYQSGSYQDDAYYDPTAVYGRFAYHFNDTSTLEFHASYLNSKGAYASRLTQAQFDEDPSQNGGATSPLEEEYSLGALVFKKQFGDDELQLKFTGKDEWFAMLSGGKMDMDFDEFELFPVVTYSWRHKLGQMDNMMLFGLEYRYHELETRIWTTNNGVRQVKLRDTLREDTSYAGYIVDQLSITDQLTVTAGVRFDSYEQEQTGRVNQDNSIGQSDNAVSPKLGATYTFNEGINLFAGFNSGFKSPARVPGANYSEGLDPEKVMSYELGFRGSPTQWFRYSIAGFMTQYKDKWAKVGTEAINPYVNSGDTEATGVELGLHFTLDSGPFADIAYTYQEAKYKDFQDKGVSYDDKWLPNIPEQMLGITIGYRSPRYGQITLASNYISERYFNKDNTLEGESYWILGAKYKKTFDEWNPQVSFFVNVDNLTDEETAVYGSGTPGNEKLRPVYGRRIYAGLEFSF